MKSIIQKGIIVNTSENPIPRQEIFKPVDHVKYEGQVRSQHLLFVQFSR